LSEYRDWLPRCFGGKNLNDNIALPADPRQNVLRKTASLIPPGPPWKQKNIHSKTAQAWKEIFEVEKLFISMCELPTF
jgi:hypothetical protein